MSKQQFFQVLQQELGRIDAAQTEKRNETVISGFSHDPHQQAIIDGTSYRIFNSNDYLGLRFQKELLQAEQEASHQYGTGPGAVRFISGSLKVHLDLEEALAKFHGREAAMLFSSAFATNVAVISSLIKGQSADSLVTGKTLVISDELNHRSIIEGIRVANLPKEQRIVFKHLDLGDLEQHLIAQQGKFDRVLVLTDGVFSMLGEYQDLASLQRLVEKYDDAYAQGILTIVDDCHGVAAFGETGRGTEEVTGAKADVLVGTLGKGLGVDGGYVVGSQVIIDYLRESAATYIYSNNIAPGSAGAALAAVQLLDTPAGAEILRAARENLAYFKQRVQEIGASFAVDSIHPIQPLLIGDPAKTKQLKRALFDAGFLVTSINYPVVPKGRDEIRIQISARHSREDIDVFISELASMLPKL